MNAAEPLHADLAVHGTAVLPHGVVPGALVLVGGNRILFAGPASRAPQHHADRVVEHAGLILPGLVDLHCHGGGGASFPDCADADEALIAVREHLRSGTTSLVGSLVTASPADLLARTAMLAPLVRSGDLAALHLEGPFISPARKGAQNPEHISGGDAALVDALVEAAGGALATMTLAPETEDALEVMRALARGGAVPSLGHTDASSAVMTAALADASRVLRAHPSRSARPTVTHLFNGMRPIHHRDPGPALAALDAAARGEAVVELVADGVHLDPRTTAHVFAIAVEGAVVLVTDAMAAAGMADGRYRLGALDVTVQEGVATLTDGGAIAGGTTHLIDVVRCAVLEAGVDLSAAVRAASSAPAAVLGLQDEIGSLQEGLRADLLLVDEELRPVQVLRGGQTVERD